MKRASILILVLLFAFAGTALASEKRIKQGDIVVGGAADFGLAMGSQTITPEEGDDITSSTLGFGLEGWMGYFVIDGLEIGPMLGFGYDKLTQDEAGQTVDDDLVTTTTSYDIGAQIGYFLDVGSVAVPYGMLRFAYAGASMSVDNGDVESTSDFTGFLVGPKLGANIFLLNTVALDLGLFLDYRSRTNTFDSGASGADSIDTDFVNMDYGLALGFNVFF